MTVKGRMILADFRKDRPIYVALGDTVHELLHLMSDLRGFTAMSERMAAHSLISMLNHYLGEMTEIIQRRNGTIIEFIGGDPYITHAVAVAGILRDWGYGADHQIAGLFHDLPEDTDASEQEIESIGGADVLRTVRLLTKQKGYIMAEYVAAIKANPVARAVKAANRLHNLRCAVAADEDFKRRYVLEPELPPAVKALAESMETPLAELPFLYEPVELWKIKAKSE